MFATNVVNRVVRLSCVPKSWMLCESRGFTLEKLLEVLRGCLSCCFVKNEIASCKQLHGEVEGLLGQLTPLDGGVGSQNTMRFDGKAILER